MTITEALKRKMAKTIEKMKAEGKDTMQIEGMDYFVVTTKKLNKGMLVYKIKVEDTIYNLYHIIKKT